MSSAEFTAKSADNIQSVNVKVKGPSCSSRSEENYLVENWISHSCNSRFYVSGVPNNRGSA